MSDSFWEHLPALVAAVAVLMGPTVLGQYFNHQRLKTIEKDTKETKTLTIEGNTAIDAVHKEVNSGADKIRSAAKESADKTELLAGQLATLVAERKAMLEAFVLAKTERDTATALRVASEQRIADLEGRLRATDGDEAKESKDSAQAGG